MKKNIKRILIVIIIVLIVCITIFLIRHKIYNNIEDDWLFKISPNYLNSPPNTVYLYKDSYIITNSFIENKWQNIVHKRGELTSEIDEEFITKIKKEANQEVESGNVSLLYSVTLNTGEQLSLTANSEVIDELTKMINYDGKIWYTTIYD